MPANEILTVTEEGIVEVRVVPDSPSNVIVLQPVSTTITVGVPGPKGQTGATGPQGPSGSSLRVLGEVTGDSSIALGQGYTTVNAPGVSTQTLPLISTVLVGGMTDTYTVKNLSTHNVTLAAAGADTIEDGATVDIRFKNESLTVVATNSGWRII